MTEQMTEDDLVQWYTALGFPPEDAKAQAHAVFTASGFPEVLPDGTPADF